MNINNANHLADENLNVDPNPIVIRKKPEERLTHVQNVSLKFLKPPQPEQPGDITIIQEPDRQEPPLPPLFIRQMPKPPVENQNPIIYREKPPKVPNHIPEQTITIPGRVVQRPRRVIVEQFAPKPPKPQPIIIERWLAYPKQTREVIYEQKPPPIFLDYEFDYQKRTPQIIEEVVTHNNISSIPMPLQDLGVTSYETYN